MSSTGKKRNYNKKKSNETTEINLKNTSIDILCTQKMLYFKELQETVLPRKKLELEKKIRNNIDIGVADLEKEISDIVNRVEENEYFLENMNTLKEYEEHTQSTFTLKPDLDVKVFGKKNSGKIDEKGKALLDKYISDNYKVNPSYAKTPSKKGTVCENCNEFDTIIAKDGFYTCRNCGHAQSGVIISDEITYNDKSHSYSIESVDYRRINYFKENLFQIQGKEHTEIPQDLLDRIINELVKERISDLSKVNIEKIKLILKKIGKSTWYEHASIITSKVTNRPPVKIPALVQEKMFYMFDIVEKYFKEHSFRPHFFSYPYIIHKLFELLDLPEYYEYFVYLNDRIKLNDQDIMWKTVVEDIIRDKNRYRRFDINWRFIKST